MDQILWNETRSFPVRVMLKFSCNENDYESITWDLIMTKENKHGINSGFSSLCFTKELTEPFKAK